MMTNKKYKPTTKPASKPVSKASSYGINSQKYRQEYMKNLNYRAKAYAPNIPNPMGNLQSSIHNFNIQMNNGGSSAKPFISYGENNSNINDDDFVSREFWVKYIIF